MQAVQVYLGDIYHYLDHHFFNTILPRTPLRMIFLEVSDDARWHFILQNSTEIRKEGDIKASKVHAKLFLGSSLKVTVGKVLLRGLLDIGLSGLHTFEFPYFSNQGDRCVLDSLLACAHRISPQDTLDECYDVAYDHLTHIYTEATIDANIGLRQGEFITHHPVHPSPEN